jgi:hypothetical protein
VGPGGPGGGHCPAGGRPPAQPAGQQAGRRPVRGRLLQPAPHRLLRRPEPRAGSDRRGGLGRPLGRAGRTARRGTGVLLREPRRGDRGDALAPAWADLRVPVHHPAHRPHAGLLRQLPARDRQQPVRRPPGRRGGGLVQDRPAGHPLDSVRPLRRPLAVRGPHVPPPPGARAGGADGRGESRVLRALPRPAAPVRPALRPPGAVHLGLAPGAGPPRRRRFRPAPGAVHRHARAGQAEVPGRVGVGHGRLRQRHRPRGGRPLPRGGRAYASWPGWSPPPNATCRVRSSVPRTSFSSMVPPCAVWSASNRSSAPRTGRPPAATIRSP